MPELEYTPIRQETYDALKPGVRTWIEQDLKWKREDIFDISIKNEILPDGSVLGEDGKMWAQWKQGKHVDITLENLTQEKQSQRFVRLDNGDWQKKENLDVPAFMQHVRERGFDIEDKGWIHGVIRRFLISKGDLKNYIDVDNEILTQDILLLSANSFMDTIER